MAGKGFEFRISGFYFIGHKKLGRAQEIITKAYAPGVESANLDYANAACCLLAKDEVKALELLKKAFLHDASLKRRVVKDRLFHTLKDDARLHAILR
jgi:hypothetical protein